MTSLKALKPVGKGAEPPTRGKAPGNTKKPDREKGGINRPLQVQVPEDVLEDFSREAAETFGFKPGNKSQMFLRLWNHYQKTK